MDINGLTNLKILIDKAIESKFPKKRGVRKSKIYDPKEDCWFMTREVDRKNLFQIYVIKEEGETIRIYKFFDSKIAGFIQDEGFTLQSTRAKVKEMMNRCKVRWQDCPVDIIQIAELSQSKDTTMSQN